MVPCIEPNQLRLDPTFVKAITGGDPVVAELYKAPFTYWPQFLLNMVTNDKPAIDDGTDGMWRRIVLAPWMVQVPEEERLPEHLMTEKLRAATAGILNWLLDGCRTRRANGLSLPEPVRSATGDYRLSEDVVLTFLTESGVPARPRWLGPPSMCDRRLGALVRGQPRGRAKHRRPAEAPVTACRQLRRCPVSPKLRKIHLRHRPG